MTRREVADGSTEARRSQRQEGQKPTEGAEVGWRWHVEGR